MFLSIYFFRKSFNYFLSVFPDDILEEMSSHKFDKFNNESGKNIF